MRRLTIERTVIGVLVAGFAIGTITHTLQLINAGWIVFATAPRWMNDFWTALTLLDPVAAALLLRQRSAGMVLGIAIMLSDVAINSYAFYALRLPVMFAAFQAQTLFCGFLLGAAGFLITMQTAPGTCHGAADNPALCRGSASQMERAATTSGEAE